MNLRWPCPRCWGSGKLVVRGERVPDHELSGPEVAANLVLGGSTYRSRELQCYRCGGSGQWRWLDRAERNRMQDMNRTFSKLAANVDAHIQDLRDAEAEVERLSRELGLARINADECKQALTSARDEMFEAFPELRPDAAQVRVEEAGNDWQPPGPGAFTPIEVDDPDDVPDFRERG